MSATIVHLHQVNHLSLALAQLVRLLIDVEENNMSIQYLILFPSHLHNHPPLESSFSKILLSISHIFFPPCSQSPTSPQSLHKTPMHLFNHTPFIHSFHISKPMQNIPWFRHIEVFSYRHPLLILCTAQPLPPLIRVMIYLFTRNHKYYFN